MGGPDDEESRAMEGPDATKEAVIEGVGHSGDEPVDLAMAENNSDDGGVEAPGTVEHDPEDDMDIVDEGRNDERKDEQDEDADDDDQDEDEDADDDDFGEDFGEDFGDFGEADDDFGDFDEGQPQEPIETTQPAQGPSIPVLQEQSFKNSARLQADVAQLLRPVFGDVPETPEIVHPKDTYFSERSEALWNQLAVSLPHVSPIDWKRSSIRRLLLVSLGVPLNLDEILPKANTKRLVLPTVASGRRRSSGAASKPAGAAGASSDKQTPEDDDEEQRLWQWHQLATVSAEARDNMADDALEAHLESLKEAIPAAKAVLEAWTAKKESAVKDKEAFEGVIESLVEYAQRVRQKS